MTGRTKPVTGAMLDSELGAWLRRTGARKADFARASGVPAQSISHLLRCKRPKQATIDAIRNFIAANPDRLPEAAKTQIVPVVVAQPVIEPMIAIASVERTLAESVQAEANGLAERRASATAGGCSMLPTTTAERIATEMLRRPSDLVAHVQQRWPELWARLLVRAREEKSKPGALLFAVIERGLGEEVTCG